MSLSQSFNEFAGKVISGQEMASLLKAAGYDSDALKFDEVQITQKALELQNSGRDEEFRALLDALTKPQNMYITKETALLIEQDALSMDDPDLSLAALQRGFKRHMKDAYVPAQPYVQGVTMFIDDDKKLTTAFVKAVQACKDHSAEVGTKLVDINSVTASIVKKLAVKFGL
jgi:hypothetical protein